MSMLPMAMYGLEVPCGDIAVTASPDIPSAFRITMAAIDPSAEPEGDEDSVPRSTLKVIRQSLIGDEDGSDEDDDFNQEEMERILAEEALGDSESDEEDEDEDVNGGPSDPSKSKQAKREAAQKQIKKLLEEEGMDVDDEDDEDDEQPNGINGIAKSAKAKGKMPASDEDDEDSDMDDEGLDIEEYVICTLDPNKLYQQPLDITFGEDERVFFKVSGTHSIYLTGNYVEPMNGASGMFDPDSDEEDEYDLEPDEDELDEDDEEIDDLDDLEDPRITEVEEEDEEAPALVKAHAKNVEDKPTNANKNKRPAPDSMDEDEDEAEGGAEGLDDMITKESAKVQSAVNGEQKLSRKQLKKLKKNNGAAAAAPAVVKIEEKVEVEVDAPSSTKSDKKVSFAKELEQGPTPTKTPSAASNNASETSKSKPSLGVKTVQGVTCDDRKLGEGQAAKNGDRVSMRYIGRLKENMKVFDSNKKGKPFSFKLGSGTVIKGWDIGVLGMQAGGERRITIPAHLAYGSKKQGEIPPNSALLFDVKMLEINKK